MNKEELYHVVKVIAASMENNKNELIRLDQQNGDGDLGISMCDGYRAVEQYLQTATEKDLGKLLSKAGDCFNEAAPSSLGTITAFGFKGMAIALKGKEEAGLPEIAEAMQRGLDRIMQRAGSKPGQKTILDSLTPGVDALLRKANEPIIEAVKEAAVCARAGSEATRTMRAVWGRAAYYGDASIGILDGGSVVGALIFEAVRDYYLSK